MPTEKLEEGSAVRAGVPALGEIVEVLAPLFLGGVVLPEPVQSDAIAAGRRRILSVLSGKGIGTHIQADLLEDLAPFALGTEDVILAAVVDLTEADRNVFVAWGRGRGD